MYQPYTRCWVYSRVPSPCSQEADNLMEETENKDTNIECHLEWWPMLGYASLRGTKMNTSCPYSVFGVMVKT